LTDSFQDGLLSGPIYTVTEYKDGKFSFNEWFWPKLINGAEDMAYEHTKISQIYWRSKIGFKFQV
jgi:hypothetical protein